jgi:multiple sugar transport system substrate-binding protein
MAEAGGTYTTDDKSKFTFDSDANVQGLSYVQKLAKEGVLKFPKQVGAGWGGEAFGKGLAAMTVEGNWIVGAMQSDYSSVKYKIVALPAGPGRQQGTLSFTNCWGIASASKSQSSAIDFVNYLTTPEQQVSFAKAFGVMPSRDSAKAGFIAALPAQQAFVDGAAHALGPVTTTGFADVQKNFDSAIINLATTSDPKTMLKTLQTNATALLN